MGDESTRDAQPDDPQGPPAADPIPPAAKQSQGWQAEPARDWERRPNEAWQTGAPAAWSSRPNEAWQTGAHDSWGARSNPLWEAGTAPAGQPPAPETAPVGETSPTLPLPPQPAVSLTALTEPLTDVPRGNPTMPPGFVVPPGYAPPSPGYAAPSPGYAPPQAWSAQPGLPAQPASSAPAPYGPPGLPAQADSRAYAPTVQPGYPPHPTVASSPGGPSPFGASAGVGTEVASVPERRSRTALWVSIGAVIVVVVIALIVVFSIWLGNRVESLWNAGPGPVAASPSAPPTAASPVTPSPAEPSGEPTTAPTTQPDQPSGDRVPIDVASTLPEGTDFAVASGSSWTGFGTTFLGGADGEFWATSLTDVFGDPSDTDARRAAEDLLRLLATGSVDGIQSVWVSGPDGRSYEFLAAESDGMGVMVRVEPESGRQFALVYSGTATEITANLVLQ